MNREQRRAQDFRPSLQDMAALIKHKDETVNTLAEIIEAQKNALNRIRNLHVGLETDEVGRMCGLCACCGDDWPCQTIEVLDGKAPESDTEPCIYCHEPVQRDIWIEENNMCVDCSNKYYEHEIDPHGYADYQHDQMKEREAEQD